jgi:hypothetical protein
VSVRTRRLLAAAVVVVALAGTAGCLGEDDTEPLRAEVAGLTAEVETLQALLDDVVDRHDRTRSATERLRQILDDPDAFGTEVEVVAQLAQMSADDATMTNDVFGSAGIRSAWTSTLFGGWPGSALEARVDTVSAWVAEDGSMSGSLWVWHGTNTAGRPFELAGVQVSQHDETGRSTEIRIHYPYDDAYVLDAVDGTGTPTGVLRTE